VLSRHAQAVADNRFLWGNFLPVRGELFATDLPILGSLPHDLDGLFARNGKFEA
jgi:carotenoid cleavage dioxygenase-like enzyme